MQIKTWLENNGPKPEPNQTQKRPNLTQATIELNPSYFQNRPGAGRDLGRNEPNLTRI